MALVVIFLIILWMGALGIFFERDESLFKKILFIGLIVLVSWFIISLIPERTKPQRHLPTLFVPSYEEGDQFNQKQ